MDIQNFIAEFKKTFVYDILSQTLPDEQLFEHVVDGDAVLWFKEQTRQMWLMWEKAKANAVPEGFVLVPKDRLTKAVDGIEALFEEDCTLALGQLLPIQQDLNAMIEAQEPAK
ncbi:hypothetical protein [Acinetobacter sp. YH12126]|uniref:hypothetical protein n=1 Tax=Acinetobacter sp. YH12126 TaxID=2601111 RepID=UPI0015D44E99|nr:hypothetical protein [Acinetobacter sp. YH12126]